MPWYYAENGQQVGPVTDEQFQSLVAAGTVRAETLVWRDGMPTWQPYSNISPAASAPPSPGTPPLPGAAPLAGNVICAECRQSFPPEQTVRFGDAYVCPNCKPTYVQKLREGAITYTPGTYRYGGFWIRVVAKIVDGLIVGIPTGVLYMLFGMGMGFGIGSLNTQNPNPAAISAMIAGQLALSGVGLLLGAAYNIYFIAKHNATPGKMIFGLKVINADGSPISIGKATGRFFADMLSRLTCYIGYIIAGFDDQRRTLHDHICNTRVVYK